MKEIYGILSVFNLIRAIFKGPAAVGRYGVRRYAHRKLAREMRRHGL